jgi:alkylhydroperoxidase/carboxymuconolactone decarboxylase family protein YurZ
VASIQPSALKAEFIRLRGYWTPAWEEVLKAFPEHFAAYLDLSKASHGGPLDSKTKELIAIAVSSSVTHLHEPSLRGHIKNALKLGVTKAEILEVLALVAILGIHSMSYSVPLLLPELERLGKPVDTLNLSARAKEVQDAWVAKRGYWPRNFTAMLAVDPDFVAAFSHFAELPRIDGPLDRKTIELIYVAVDGSATHLFGEGVRVHALSAMEHGATVAEIKQTLELTTAIGMHSMMFGVPILMEELALAETASLS